MCDPYDLAISAPPRPGTRPHGTHSRLAARPRTSLSAGVALAALVAVLLAGCSGLLGASSADVVVQLEAKDQRQVKRVRSDVLSSASTWGGVRVGEQTGDVGDSALEFTLPGANLDIALGSLGDVDARVVSTEIDVDPAQIERPSTPAAEGGSDQEATAGQVRLRVEVSAEPEGGLGSIVRLAMSVFSLIGVVATYRWLRDAFGRRTGERRTRNTPSVGTRTRRSIDRFDLRDDPPTQETPRIPPQW